MDQLAWPLSGRSRRQIAARLREARSQREILWGDGRAPDSFPGTQGDDYDPGWLVERGWGMFLRGGIEMTSFDAN